MSDRYNERIATHTTEGETIKTTRDALAYLENQGFYISLGSDDTMANGRKVKPNYRTWHLYTPTHDAHGVVIGEAKVAITEVATYSNGGVSSRNLITFARLHQAARVKP